MAEALPLVDRVVVLEPGGGVRADGPPAAVFAAHGDALADAGSLGAGPVGAAPAPGGRRRGRGAARPPSGSACHPGWPRPT